MRDLLNLYYILPYFVSSAKSLKRISSGLFLLKIILKGVIHFIEKHFVQYNRVPGFGTYVSFVSAYELVHTIYHPAYDVLRRVL